MTYEEAKEKKIQINEEYDIASENIRQFERNAMGLIPDHIRESEEYKDADYQERLAFAKLRKFNEWFLKNFKKEYMKERSAKRFNK